MILNQFVSMKVIMTQTSKMWLITAKIFAKSSTNSQTSTMTLPSPGVRVYRPFHTLDPVFCSSQVRSSGEPNPRRSGTPRRSVIIGKRLGPSKVQRNCSWIACFAEAHLRWRSARSSNSTSFIVVSMLRALRSLKGEQLLQRGIALMFQLAEARRWELAVRISWNWKN